MKGESGHQDLQSCGGFPRTKVSAFTLECHAGSPEPHFCISKDLAILQYFVKSAALLPNRSDCGPYRERVFWTRERLAVNSNLQSAVPSVPTKSPYLATLFFDNTTISDHIPHSFYYICQLNYTLLCHYSSMHGGCRVLPRQNRKRTAVTATA